MTEPDDPPARGGGSGRSDGEPDGPDATAAGLDVILGEVDQVVDPVTESVGMSPAVGIAVAGGPMITLPDDGPTTGAESASDSIRPDLGSTLA